MGHNRRFLMNRPLWSVLALCGVFGGESLTGRAGAQPVLPGAMRVAGSKPVTRNDARFVAVAQTQWTPGKPNREFTVVVPLDIQLRITNLSERTQRFPTFKTFGLRITTVDGKEVKAR